MKIYALITMSCKANLDHLFEFTLKPIEECAMSGKP